MNEFGTKSYSRWLRWVARAALGVLFGAFVATWIILLRWWDQLDVTRVYIYGAFFIGYVIVEQRTFRGPDEAAYTEHIWVRYLLTYTWWFLMLGSLLEHAVTRRDDLVVTIIGLLFSLVGLALGYWSSRTIRDKLAPRVDTWGKMEIVREGPYAVIRHPSYAANILLVVGMPLIVNAYLSLVLSAILIVLFVRRLLWEEEILTQRLPAYADYVPDTDRLIPGIW